MAKLSPWSQLMKSRKKKDESDRLFFHTSADALFWMMTPIQDFEPLHSACVYQGLAHAQTHEIRILLHGTN